MNGDIGPIGDQVKDFQSKYDKLQGQVRELVAENDSLRSMQVKQSLNHSTTTTSAQPFNNTNNDVIASQLMETESFLAQERQQVVRVTHQASGFQRQNEQLRRYVQQMQQQVKSQQVSQTAQIEKLTASVRESKSAENQRAIQLDEAKARVDQLEKILTTKNSILQKTKDERDEINMQNEKRTIEVETKNLDLLTQSEQNTALKKQVRLLTGHFTAAEQRQMDLNAALVTSNGKRDEMGQRLRELEEMVKGTVRREMELGIKERQMEQLAEDYQLELNDAKAKITNLAFQVSSLKEQNKQLLDEMGDKVRSAIEEIRAKSNREMDKTRNELDHVTKGQLKLKEEVERAKREKRTVEGVLENVLKGRRSDKSDELAQYQSRLNEERKVKDSLLEQIRQLSTQAHSLRRELVEREQWNASDLEHAKKCEISSKDEMTKMRAVLNESGAENKNLAKAITRAQCEKEKTELQLKVRIGDLEELLHHSNIKLKSGAVDGIQTTTIRTLQEELSSARAQLERWRVEAVQVAQEADQKLRHHRAELQTAKINNNELRADLKELVDKNAGFARQCQEGERDRAQLQARVVTLQQKLKPFLTVNK